MIHPTAIVAGQTILGDSVQIGPYAIVEAGVEIGDRTILAAHTVIRSGTRLGADCQVDSFSVLGGCPNFLGFDPQTPSHLEIGDRCVIRESVTIHRSIQEGAATVLGSECFLMAGSHVGHDCRVATRVVLANQSALAGHVCVGENTFLGGGAMIHQFTRIGEGVMISGLARITKDIAPFVLAAERDQISGLNLVGLRRRKVPADTIRQLKELYWAILRSPGNPVETAAKQALPASAEARRFLEFFIPSKRGYVKNGVAGD